MIQRPARGKRMGWTRRYELRGRGAEILAAGGRPRSRLIVRRAGGRYLYRYSIRVGSFNRAARRRFIGALCNNRSFYKLLLLRSVLFLLGREGLGRDMRFCRNSCRDVWEG